MWKGKSVNCVRGVKGVRVVNVAEGGKSVKDGDGEIGVQVYKCKKVKMVEKRKEKANK